MGPPKSIAARSSVTSSEPRDSGRSGTHHISKGVLADRRAKAIARDRRSLDRTLSLLSEDSGRRLAREFAPGHVCWRITPIGFSVPARIAERAIACHHVVVDDPGLFPGADTAQTFRIRVPGRIVSGRGRARASGLNDDDF
jgi:hypothetical protein